MKPANSGGDYRTIVEFGERTDPTLFMFWRPNINSNGCHVPVELSTRSLADQLQLVDQASLATEASLSARWLDPCPPRWVDV
jgi:hypothetical protein